MKRQPKKPSRPLCEICFYPNGSVERRTEKLPASKDDLEMAIGVKFIEAMRKRFRRELATPWKVPREEFPDLHTKEKGKDVWLEVVEVVNVCHIRLGLCWFSVKWREGALR